MSTPEQCAECGAELTEPQVIHTTRRCERCGKITYKHPTSAGLRVEAGDTPVIPAGAIKLSLDPQEATGHFTEFGVSFFVRMLLGDKAAPKQDEIVDSLRSLRDQGNRFLEKSPLLADPDPDSATDSRVAYERLEKQKETREWLAMCTASFAGVALTGIETGDPGLAAWGVQQAMVSHAAFVFEANLKDLVWRGYLHFGVDQISQALQLWEDHKANPDEEFWHQVLRERPFLLNQLLGSAVVIEGDKAYVGGTGVTATGGKFADFLIRHPVLDNVSILEIKTPSTPLLLKTAYRSGVYGPSKNLSGGVVQLAGYRDSLLKSYYALVQEGPAFRAVNPRCVLLIGSAEQQLGEPEQQRSFELFRSELRGVDVVTYDELFLRAKVLLDLMRSP